MEKNFKKKEAKGMSGCSSMSKAYKFTVDPGYLHDIKGNVNWLNNFLLSIVTRGNSIIFHSLTYCLQTADAVKVSSNCFR